MTIDNRGESEIENGGKRIFAPKKKGKQPGELSFESFSRLFLID